LLLNLMTTPIFASFQPPFFAGVDVGGTNIKIGIVDDAGRTVCESKISTSPQRSSLSAFQDVERAFDEMASTNDLNWEDIVGVGLGTPGPLNVQSGLILTPSNLPGWHDSPVRDQLSELLGKPVVLANDAGAAAFGEYWVGSGRRYDSLVMLTLGTGVGGGIIVEGSSIDGANSHGAELGHITIDTSPNARRCGCGQRGHLEAYASATALVERTKEALSMPGSSEGNSTLATRISENSPLSALMIAQAASAGDELAVRMIDETAHYLAAGIAILSFVIDPAAFVLGGAMNFGGNDSPLGQKFLRDVVTQVRQLVFPVVAEGLQVEFATLGGSAGFVGAAGLARYAYIRQNLRR
jgi:glucokinase